jgi:hypothetical protein
MTFSTYNPNVFDPAYIKNGHFEEDVFFSGQYLLNNNDMIIAFECLKRFINSSLGFIDERLEVVDITDDFEFIDMNNLLSHSSSEYTDLKKIESTLNSSLTELKKINIHNIMFDNVNTLRNSFYSIASNILHEISDYVLKYHIIWPYIFILNTSPATFDTFYPSKNDINKLENLRISTPKYY